MCTRSRVYSEERNNNIELLKESWKQLSNTAEVPETLRINEYDLFLKLTDKRKPEQYEKFQITLLRIKEIEQVR